jgi:hypothetical protein
MPKEELKIFLNIETSNFKNMMNILIKPKLCLINRIPAQRRNPQNLDLADMSPTLYSKPNGLKKQVLDSASNAPILSLNL